MPYTIPDSQYNYRLARFLLNFKEGDAEAIASKGSLQDINPALLSDNQIIEEINLLLRKIKPFRQAGLSSYKLYRGIVDKLVDPREHKEELFEEHHVYDKYIASTLREFCIITIALLSKLEKMHKKGILCGNISPYNFMYNQKRKMCEPCDLAVVLSDSKQVRAEKQLHGDLIYVHADLYAIEDNKYLAPELKQTMQMFSLQRRLKSLKYMADYRGLLIDRQDEIQVILHDFHQQKIIYSNKAEIYSAGYTLNQILSHMLEKLAALGLTIGQPTPDNVNESIIEDADLLLPDKFANPSNERIIDRLNEGVSYIYDLMHEHIEQRDSLAESIEKFRSLLKRIGMIEPILFMDEGEEREEALEAKREELEIGELEEFETPEEAEEAEEAEEKEEKEEEEEEEEKEREEEEIEHEDHLHALHEHEHTLHHEHHEHEGEHEGAHEEHAEHVEHGHAGHGEHGHEEHIGHGEHGGHADHAAHGEHGGHADHAEHGDHDAHADHGAHADHAGHEAHTDHAGHEIHDDHAGEHGAEHLSHEQHTEGEAHGEHSDAGHGSEHDAGHDFHDIDHDGHPDDHSDQDVAHDAGASRTPGTTGYKPTTMLPRR